jgi:hypothetical protein
MTKLLTAIALAATLLTAAAHAGDLPDNSDRSLRTCDADTIQDELEILWEGNLAGIKLIYIKGDPVETSRNRNELRCRVIVVTSKGPVSGVFRFVNQDGHALVGFQPGKSK